MIALQFRPANNNFYYRSFITALDFSFLFFSNTNTNQNSPTATQTQSQPQTTLATLALSLASHVNCSTPLTMTCYNLLAYCCSMVLYSQVIHLMLTQQGQNSHSLCGSWVIYGQIPEGAAQQKWVLLSKQKKKKKRGNITGDIGDNKSINKVINEGIKLKLFKPDVFCSERHYILISV